jgi:hypothetical protein
VVDLAQLEKLPGAADQNFEVLTRAVVSRRYGGLGPIRERRQQPGVEFYLSVEHDGPLGARGRVWGWSCKWFVLTAKNELTKSQRTLIEEALDKAKVHVANLTDFVLCLPFRPAKKDEEWFATLGSARKLSLHLWTGENYEAQLAGCDELRSTFFGELVLTPTILAEAHERSVRPVKARWLPPLHTSNHVQRNIERVLLAPASFDELDEHAQDITTRAAALRAALSTIGDTPTHTAAETLVDDLDTFVAGVQAIVEAGRNRRPEEVRQRLEEQRPPGISPRQLRALLLQLRKRRIPAALEISGVAVEIRTVMGEVAQRIEDLQRPMVAVVAPAGLGKTHLAAEITSPAGKPTAGVFVHGGKLRSGGTLDDLARKVPGVRGGRFEDLLEALNSSGARAGTRIPLVIDGLNEAERPSEWRPLLDETVPELHKYPYVLLIVTLREILAERAIPNEALKVSLEWQEPEVRAIVTTYFRHYLINAAGAWLPRTMFKTPLFVRMYCEAANPDRTGPVGVEALPASLIGVFELYRENVIRRLADDPARRAIPADQIKRRLAVLAELLWTRRTRTIASDEARAILDGGQTDWDESLFRRLVEEGVLLRDEVDSGEDVAALLFDRFAGYLIADARLRSTNHADIEDRLTKSDLWQALEVDGHALGEDVIIGLIGLLPRRFSGHHLWRYAPAGHRSWVLAQELESEASYLDGETVDELAALFPSWDWRPAGRRSGIGIQAAFDRLWEVRTSAGHRLNAVFLDRVLRRFPLAHRDQRWTEWIRSRAEAHLTDDLRALAEHWSRELARAAADDLNALSVAWLLTSTSRNVRDLATKTLQRYGRHDPKRLFDLATRMLDVDDPYVVERVVGAAFGAASTHQMPDPGGPFERALSEWLVTLNEQLINTAAPRTAHEILRSYVRATFELAGSLHPAAVPDGVDPFALRFAAVSAVPVMSDDDPNAAEAARTFGDDFENYVIGSIIEGRDNYDFDHPDYRRARGEVVARIWELGWRESLLGTSDQSITYLRNGARTDRANIERYGKKFGWIAYHELVGRLTDTNRHRKIWAENGRNISPDIDPTFPEEPSTVPFALPEWAPAGAINDQEWIANGVVALPPDVWSPAEIHDVAGGWLLVEGFLEHRRDGRKVFGLFRTMLLKDTDAVAALTLLNECDYPGNHLIPELPTARDIFAGEIPWSPRFRLPVDEADPHGHSALRTNWQDDGIALQQLAVSLTSSDTSSPAAIQRAYDVPSFEIADRFRLRQLPGTLDLVDTAGVRASAAFRADGPWRGQLLFVRHDLVRDFAGDRKIVQICWGERETTVAWHAVPKWLRTAHRTYQHIWRHVREVPASGNNA